jgi:hypothetical protein
MRIRARTLRLQVILILPVDGSADNTLPAVIFTSNAFYKEMLFEEFFHMTGI